MNKGSLPIRFYGILSLAMLSLAIIIVLTARFVFSALKTANEVDDVILNASTPRIIEIDYRKAVDTLNSKSAPPLDSL
jgi:hypothetical protein